MLIGDEINIKNKGKGKLILILGSQYLVEFNGEKIKISHDQIIQDGDTTYGF